ncbi:MAG: nucleotidyltransferase substrate binding protein [Magnetococcales bacterium]|nr:nucleotidyltransferase substrate binding protein [Magnetococcales bacterium]
MALNFTALARSIQTLEASLNHLEQTEGQQLLYEVFRNAVSKGFELTLESSGTALRKVLREYHGDPGVVNRLVFKDLFRHAARHELLSPEAVQRWLLYRDLRNDTAHQYGEALAKQTLAQMHAFIADAKALHLALESQHGDTPPAT